MKESLREDIKALMKRENITQKVDGNLTNLHENEMLKKKLGAYSIFKTAHSTFKLEL